MNTVIPCLTCRAEKKHSSGVSYCVTVPGEGVVLLEAGRVEFNEAGEVVFVAGPHQVLGQDFDTLRGISRFLTGARLVAASGLRRISLPRRS